MIAEQISERYARALFMAAKGRNLIDQAYEQFGVIKIVLARDKSLLEYLTAPQITDERKKELMTNVFAPRLEKLFMEFLYVLMEKHRITFLAGIIDAFERLVEVEKGLVRVQVITAVALSPDEERDARAQLELRTGRKVLFEKKIDPTIIGGMIVIIDDEIIDGSVRHGLKMIEEHLGKVKVA